MSKKRKDNGAGDGNYSVVTQKGRIIMKSLQGVESTLFIPLAARVFASKKFPEYFYDEKSLAMEKYIPGDTIREKSSEYAFMASVARYYNMDNMVKSFISKHRKCNIVYLGAGLETAYYRLNNPSTLFYEVDLPEVIDIRRSILGEHENEILLDGDMFDTVWIDKINAALPSLLIVSGVFQYFTEEKVVRFITDIRAGLKGAELIFDATNETGIKYANRYVRKTGNTGALMHFYVNDSIDFARKTGTVLIEERVFFTDARKVLAKKLGFYTRIAMRIVDNKKRAIILHLKIN
ncbi:MAG: class I SAM-dependent methyltransferase [Tannerella sp.]|jgi:O-methyltransferase involved in polyketide biosynthesis|nr:class I SAM-dependent methyltransferase [Tannerella sp.]